MSGAVTDFRDRPLTAAELEMLDRARGGELVAKRPRGAKRLLPAAGEVIDVDVRRGALGPKGQWACELAGVLIGRGWFWSGQGIAWAVRRARAAINDRAREGR
jgi:hypothetical protein